MPCPEAVKHSSIAAHGQCEFLTSPWDEEAYLRVRQLKEDGFEFMSLI